MKVSKSLFNKFRGSRFQTSKRLLKGVLEEATKVDKEASEIRAKQEGSKLSDLR
jgi:hypothetical protein